MADKLADFVAKNGAQFEEMTRSKNAPAPGNPFRRVIRLNLPPAGQLPTPWPLSPLRRAPLPHKPNPTNFAPVIRFLHDKSSGTYKYYEWKMNDLKKSFEAQKARGGKAFAGRAPQPPAAPLCASSHIDIVCVPRDSRALCRLGSSAEESIKARGLALESYPSAQRPGLAPGGVRSPVPLHATLCSRLLLSPVEAISHARC